VSESSPFTRCPCFSVRQLYADANRENVNSLCLELTRPFMPIDVLETEDATFREHHFRRKKDVKKESKTRFLPWTIFWPNEAFCGEVGLWCNTNMAGFLLDFRPKFKMGTNRRSKSEPRNTANSSVQKSKGSK
jgi:hypothetical protein